LTESGVQIGGGSRRLFHRGKGNRLTPELCGTLFAFIIAAVG
jgi:hypothetical protein